MKPGSWRPQSAAPACLLMQWVGGPVGWAWPSCEERCRGAAPGFRACGSAIEGGGKSPSRLGLGPGRLLSHMACSLDDVPFLAEFRHDQDWSC